MEVADLEAEAEEAAVLVVDLAAEPEVDLEEVCNLITRRVQKNYCFINFFLIIFLMEFVVFLRQNFSFISAAPHRILNV